MSLNIKEITETLEFNKDDLKGNRMLTNEIIVDDIMLGLGYNKRRDKSVQRLYDKLIDWMVVTAYGKKIVFKVLSLDETVDTALDMEDTLKYCAEARYSVLVVITGKTLTILRYNKIDIVYNKVRDISLEKELDTLDEQLINAISKETFDIDFIDSCIKPSFTYENLLDFIKDNAQAIHNHISSLVGEQCPQEFIGQFLTQAISPDSTNDVHQSSEDIDKLKEWLEQAKQSLNTTNTDLESVKGELETYKDQHNKDTQTIAQLKVELNNNSADTSESEELVSELEELKRLYKEKDNELETLTKASEEKDVTIQNLTKASEEKDATIQNLTKASEEKDATIQSLESKVNEQSTEIESLKENKVNSSKQSSDSTEDMQRKIDSYINKIRDLSVKISDIEEERDEALKKVEEMQKEVEELSGSDLRFAEQLLNSIDDDEDDDRSYVAVINKELLSYEDIHTFIGRCLQKLYDLKSFEASQFIFNGDIFKMDINSKFSDIIMNSKTYDVILATDNENEELNKLRIVFSHFDDVVFVCKKTGTLRKNINSRYNNIEEEQHEEVQLESDEYLPDEYEDDTVEQNLETEQHFSEEQDFSDNTQSFGGEGQSEFSFDDNSIDDPGISDLFGSEEDSMPTDEMDSGDDLFGDEEDSMPTDEEELSFEDSINSNNNSFEDSINSNNNSFENNQYAPQEFTGEVPYFDEGLESVDASEMEKHLLVAQLLNIDMLIWSEEPIKFNNIKYISTNIITFGINTQDTSYDRLLCKCIDAILAIEAFNGSKGLVHRLKQKDFSKANNFLKLYSPEYSQYPRINGTRYVVAGIESVQQVAAALLDICSIMEIDTQEIFLYFETETNSQFIVDNYDFDENAIKIAETTSYIPEDGTEPSQSIAIIRGDMFNHIVITKNSLKVHKEIFNKALAIKTKYLGVVLDKDEKVYEVICDTLQAANNSGLPIDFKAIGNVIGENYLLVSNEEHKVSPEHTEYNILGQTIYISKLEDWQVPHSFIKVHTTLFNNTAIAVKTSINSDAVNYYCSKFETSEPSLGLAVNSFADYVADCIKE